MATTLEDVHTGYVRKAGAYISARYRYWGVDYEDACQEMLCWLLEHDEAVHRWLAKGQLFRLYRAMLDAGLKYAEREKAARVGYDSSDVQWYTPSMIEGLMPLALDDEFSTLAREGEQSETKSNKPLNEQGDLLAMVLDVRRALAACPDWVESTFRYEESGVAGWDDAVQAVINVLGGDKPFVGKRRARTNAAAQYTTRNQETA